MPEQGHKGQNNKTGGALVIYSAEPEDDRLVRKRFNRWKSFFFFKNPEKLIWKAIKEKKVDFVRLLLQDGHGKDALYHAAAQNRTEQAALLIEAGANIDALSDRQDTTPLIVAAAYGHNEVLRLLIEKGADLNVRSNSYNTALICAARNDYIMAVDILLEAGAEIDLQGECGRTAILWAATKGNRDIVHLLMKHNADPTIKGGESYLRTPFEWARGNKHTKTAALLEPYEREWNKGQTPALPAPKKTVEPDTPEEDSKPRNDLPDGWSVIANETAHMAIHKIDDPVSNTTIKHIFDFKAGTLTTRVTCEDGTPTMTQQKFSELQKEFLKQAQDIADKVKDRYENDKQNNQPKLV